MAGKEGVYTDGKIAWETYAVTPKHKKLFKEVATGDACKYTLAQIMLRGEYFVTVDHCVLKLFCRTFKSFNKKEKAAIQFAFSIADAAFWENMKHKLMIDSSYGNNVKVAIDMTGGSNKNDKERVLRISVRPK